MLPLTFLPQTGVAYLFEGKPVAFGFLTKTDTPIAAICDLVTDPEALPEVRDRALRAMIQDLELKAKAFGFVAVSACANHRGLIDRYKKMGYNETDKELTLMMRLLCH